MSIEAPFRQLISAVVVDELLVEVPKNTHFAVPKLPISTLILAARTALGTWGTRIRTSTN